MNSWKKLMVMIVSLLCVSGSYSTKTLAEEVNKETNGYSVQKISPGGEVDDSSSFYDLLVKPGDKRKIEAKLINSSDKEITVESHVFTSFTNQNGEINYTSEAEEFDKSLKIKLADIADITASDIKTKLAPHSEQVISTEITVPKEAPDGVILGSWYFEKLDDEKESKQEQKGISIKSKYSYAMAIKLTVNQEIEAPNLNLMSVTTGLNNYHKVINANIQNDRPAIVSNLSMSAEVMKKGSYDVLYKNKGEGIIMAPNSNYPFPIFFNDQKVKAGDYTMKVTATTDDPKWESQTWEWSKDFTITSDEAKKLNQEAINDPEVKTEWWVYTLIGLGILIILLLLLLLIKKRKQEKNN